MASFRCHIVPRQPEQRPQHMFAFLSRECKSNDLDGPATYKGVLGLPLVLCWYSRRECSRHGYNYNRFIYTRLRAWLRTSSLGYDCRIASAEVRVRPSANIHAENADVENKDSKTGKYKRKDQSLFLCRRPDLDLSSPFCSFYAVFLGKMTGRTGWIRATP